MNVSPVVVNSSNVVNQVSGIKNQSSSNLLYSNYSTDSFQKSDNLSKNVSFTGLRKFLIELLETEAETEARVIAEQLSSLKSKARQYGISVSDDPLTKDEYLNLKRAVRFESELKPDAQFYGVSVSKEDDYYSLSDKIYFQKLKNEAHGYGIAVEPNDTAVTLDEKLKSHRPPMSDTLPDSGRWVQPDGRDYFAPYDM